MIEFDKKFYDRADEHINISNNQLKTESLGKVSACEWNIGEEMKLKKEETLNYFVTEYRKMLEENLDDYIHNFDEYIKPKK